MLLANHIGKCRRPQLIGERTCHVAIEAGGLEERRRIALGARAHRKPPLETVAFGRQEKGDGKAAYFWWWIGYAFLTPELTSPVGSAAKSDRARLMLPFLALQSPVVARPLRAALWT